MITRLLARVVMFGICVGPARAADEPALPLPAAPVHGRPFLMPPTERQRLRNLVERETWAREEYEQTRKAAAGGDGFAAAFEAFFARRGGLAVGGFRCFFSECFSICRSRRKGMKE